ncbi:MAG: beta-lactamase family protein [Gemmatimonadota bacterium]|nr:MAG: beta-lactamase family protein [Gemmatimonadota bacterium]
MIKSLAARAAVAILVLCVPGCGDDTVGPADRDDIEAWMAFYRVPGLSLAVINDFQLDYVEVHGVVSGSTREPVTAETRFQAASLSKSVSAVGVVRLAQEGVISLNTDVNDYLTSWQIPDNEFQSTEKVTLRRLLSHTAGMTVHGFRGYRYTESVPTLTQILNGEAPANSAPIVVDFVPGSEWRYSGGGYVVMQQALTDVTATPFPELMRGRVLQPLGMENSTFEQPLPEALRDRASTGHYADGTEVPGQHHVYPEMAAAGLWTTPSDLARLLIELQLSLRGESNTVLTTENTELLLTGVLSGYALGFFVWANDDERSFGHGGANDGFRCFMVAHRTGGYGVVAMANSDNGVTLIEAVVDLIGRREGWPGFE